MEYAELLKLPQWQKKRLEIFNRDKWTCTKCGDQWHNLQVHHIYYKRDALPWEYPDKAFITVCDLCHEKEEFYKWIAKIGLRQLEKECGFNHFDLAHIQNLVVHKLANNHHRESARQYIFDIKLLMSNG